MKDNTPDDALREFLSFRAYKEGKRPLKGIDPKDRVRKGAWREEGIDLEALLGRDEVRMRIWSALLATEVKGIPTGIFRRKKDRTLAVGLRDLGDILRRSEEDPDLRRALLGSEILSPLVVLGSDPGLSEVADRISLAPRQQGDVAPLLPPDAARSASSRSAKGEDELRSSFERKVPKGKELRAGSGPAMDSIGTLVRSVMEMDDDILDGLLRKGSLVSFARDALDSPALEAVLVEVSIGSDGGPEAPSKARERLGLWLMEGPLGEMCHHAIVLPFIDRLSRCRSSEAPRLERALSPLIDARSAPALADALFRSQPGSRPSVVRLLALTRSELAATCLKSLLEFSSLDTDRDEARRALASLGAL